MNRHARRTGLLLIAVTLVAFAATAAEEARELRPRVEDGPGLSLRLVDEFAPAGSTVQIKLEVTEPKPISTGRGKVRAAGIATVQGIVLMNADQDTFGVALVDGRDITFNITSPSGLFGTPADYPILGIAGTVSPNASNGATYTLSLDPGAFRTPSGAPYPLEVKSGVLTVAADALAIGDVSPGSAIVPAGGVVRISGTNFTPSTRIQLGESDIREQRFINSGRIDVVVAQTTRMHGLRVRARNEEADDDDDDDDVDNDARGGDDGSESEYFSYERTVPAGASSDPILGLAVPLFAPATFTEAIVEMPRRSSGRRRAVRPSHGSGTASSSTLGFALQNLESSSASVSVELLDSSGNVYAVNTVPVGPDRYLVRTVNEVFGIVATPSAIRFRSRVPIQALGLMADPASETATALQAR